MALHAETRSGLIEGVTRHNPENGFAVLKVKVKGLGLLCLAQGKPFPANIR